MDKEVLIRPHRTGDETALVELWKAVFKKERTVKHWKWRFDECNFGKGVVMLGLDGGAIVSAYSTNRMALKLGDDIVSAVHGFDGYTHIDYRKHGIFTDLLAKLMQDYTVEGVKFMYGYPNTNSYPVHIKMGWKGHGLIDLWEKELNTRSWSFQEGFEEVHEFDERSDQLWEQAKETVQIGIVRSRNYLNWRYMQNPSVEYHKAYLSREGKTVGMLVLKTHSDGKSETGHLIDALAVDKKTFENLVDYAIGYFSSRGVGKMTCWFKERHPFSETLLSRGFSKSKMAWTCFAVKALNDIQHIETIAENKDNWYIMMGDCDIF